MAEAFSNSAESGGEARPETNGDAVAAATPVQAQSSLQKLQEKTQALRTDLQRTRAAKQYALGLVGCFALASISHTHTHCDRRGGLSHADYGDGTDPADPDSAKLREEVKQLRNDLERRLVRARHITRLSKPGCVSHIIMIATNQASYVRREREYKTQVQVLTEELKKVSDKKSSGCGRDTLSQCGVSLLPSFPHSLRPRRTVQPTWTAMQRSRWTTCETCMPAF